MLAIFTRQMRVNAGPIIPSASAALSGTVTTATEADIVAGGKTIILTLTNTTWVVAAGSAFDNQRQNIINGLTSAQSEATGWNLVVKAGLAVGTVVRTSDTVVTITLSAFASYSISANETITVTIPSTAVAAATPIIASPTFGVTAEGASWSTFSTFNSSNYSTEYGWEADPTNPANHVSIVSSHVRMTYYDGMTGGVPPNGGGIESFAEVVFRSVVTFRVSSSPAMFGHASGTNKRVFHGINGGQNKLFTRLVTTPSTNNQPIYMGFCIQGAVVGDGNFTSAFEIVRGDTYTITTETRRNSASTADGYVKQYGIAGEFDGSNVGSLILEATGIQWTAGAATWDFFQWGPVFGGVGGVVGSSPYVPGNWYEEVKQILLQEPA